MQPAAFNMNLYDEVSLQEVFPAFVVSCQKMQGCF